MSYTITQNGDPLSASLYTVDEENKIFTTLEDNLLVDFTDLSGWCFHMDGCSWCTILADDYCHVKAGHHNTIVAGVSSCFQCGWATSYTTGPSCCFHSRGHENTFDVGDDCIINCKDSCIDHISGGVNCYVNNLLHEN